MGEATDIWGQMRLRCLRSKILEVALQSRLIVSALSIASVFAAIQIAVAADENTFTADVAQSFSMATGGKSIHSSPLTLLITMPDDDKPEAGLQVDLDRIWSYCGRNPSDCQRSIFQYVTRTAQIRRQQSVPVEINTSWRSYAPSVMSRECATNFPPRPWSNDSLATFGS